jgi:uncharacterized UBP type Zn finger protein
MGCSHLGAINQVVPNSHLCQACVEVGDTWVHLRMCLTCGLVGCCDSSPNRHASAHGRESAHPLIRSIEPGEDWRWCFIDEEFL